MTRKPGRLTGALLSLTLTLLLSNFASAQTAFRIGDLTIPPGQVRSGFLAVPAGADGDSRIPLSVIRGAKPGPALAVIAGNHGFEYPPILATQRLLAGIDPAQLDGTLILVHVANMPSFLKRTIYYSPIDGKNLNRVYPGKESGSISDRIAYVITHEVIERADYVIDMHCGDGNESLTPFSYWEPVGNEKVDARAREMVTAFGIPKIVIDRSDPRDPAASRYCSNTGSTRGKPSITIESGGMGVAYDEADITRIVSGVENVMRLLGMLPGRAQPTKEVTWYEPSQVLTFPTDLPEKSGLFFPKARKSQKVEKGEILGYVTDFRGKKIYDLRAPFAGDVLYIIRTPPTSAGEPLAFVAAPKRPEESSGAEGFSSDRNAAGSESAARVLVVYYSATGNTAKMAEAVAAGARQVQATEVEVRKTNEVSTDDLKSADGIVLGSPTYWGNMAGPMKSFIDDWLLKYRVPLIDKVGASFASGGGVNGGMENVLYSLNIAMLSGGIVLVGPIKGEFGGFGVAAVSPVNDEALKESQSLGKRVATMVHRFKKSKVEGN